MGYNKIEREREPMKKLLCLLLSLLLCLPLAACGGAKTYSAQTFAFDTIISLTACCDSEEDFLALKEVLFSRLQELHQAFDIYHEYSGQTNLYTVNHSAGQPVAVSGDILELLRFGQKMHDLTEGRVNIAAGALLSQWKTARDTGVLPEEAALTAAMAHCSIEDLLLEGETVTLLDPEMSLDVGAVAKGWAAQKAAEAADALGLTNYALSAGGNVITRGQVNGRLWNVGVRDPRSADANATAAVVQAGDLAVVTSGGYERKLTVNDKDYCHIIDPFTGYPVDHMLSVTVVCEDSGLADGLSTALFLMEPEAALAFAKMQGVRALVISHDGTVLDSTTK